MTASDAEAFVLEEVIWPYERLAEALREALLRSDLRTIATAVVEHLADTGPRSARSLVPWLRHAGRGMGVEGAVQRVDSTALEETVGREGAYLVVLRGPAPHQLQAVALVRTAHDVCVVIRPDGGEARVRSATFCGAIGRATERASSVARLFDGLPGGQTAWRRLVSSGGLGAAELVVARYGLDAVNPLLSQLAEKSVGLQVAAYVGITVLQGALAVVAAITLGNAAVTGVVDLGRIVAWGVLTASNVPLQYVASLIVGRASLDIAEILKRRLLEGALAIRDEEVRKQGFGLLLARLNEATVVEQARVTDIVGVLAPVGQLIAAGILLSNGALRGLLVPLFGSFLLALVPLGARLYRRYRACYGARMDLTEDLVEKIIGHRTRAVQAPAASWHVREDTALYAYAEDSDALVAATSLSEIYGRLWLFVGGAGLFAAFALGADMSQLLLSAVAVYLAHAGFPALLRFVAHLSAWVCAWEGIRPLFAAGGVRARPSQTAEPAAARGLETVLSSLSFAYTNRPRSVLSNVNLRIRSGERLLIEGPSGSGKSTLSKLLTGELRPTGGTILVDGVDVLSVSAAEWRRHVAASPQFHENYLFSNTFAFNVDPKTSDGDVSEEAMAVCEELGLGVLLEKMPSGTSQILGETGWQLSHGERSRVFIARSLLQGAELLIFDESFGALDPELLERALSCVRRRARTLVVIGHR